MAVYINFKICDNASECGGIEVCPTGALTWDEEKETIKIDNEKCISCGKCEKECPIGAIRVGKTDEECKKIEREIEEDKRTTKDLFVDRYGAAPLSEFFMIEEAEIEEKIFGKSLVLIECYQDSSIQCLLKSIPVKEITKGLPSDTLFYKASFEEEKENEFGIQEFPALLIYQEGKLKGKVEGYFETSDKEKFMNQVNTIIGG